jgi:hypothetical protein
VESVDQDEDDLSLAEYNVIHLARYRLSSLGQG